MVTAFGPFLTYFRSIHRRPHTDIQAPLLPNGLCVEAYFLDPLGNCLENQC